MAIPEGYEKLAVVGIAWKGDYVAGTAYKVMNAVYYNGSTYVALRDNPTGAPMADSTNWQYLAKGFVAALLSMVTAKDTSGIMGTAGADVGAQDLMDAIANKMVAELVSNSAMTEKLTGYLLKTQIVNNLLATVPGNVLDAMQGKALGDAIAKQNSDLANKGIIAPYSGSGVVDTDLVSNIFRCNYRVVNGICFFRFDFSVNPITADGVVLVKGLPIAAYNTILQCEGWKSGASYGIPLEIDLQGNLAAYTCPGGYIAGYITYPVK